MTETRPVELTEDRIPFDGIEESISELVDLYGGEITAAVAATCSPCSSYFDSGMKWLPLASISAISSSMPRT